MIIFKEIEINKTPKEVQEFYKKNLANHIVNHPVIGDIVIYNTQYGETRNKVPVKYLPILYKLPEIIETSNTNGVLAPDNNGKHSHIKNLKGFYYLYNKIQYGEELLNLTLNIMVLSNEQKYYMFSFKKIKESQKPISIMFIDMNLSGRGMTLNNIINENNKNVNPIKETKIGDVFWLGDSMKIEVVGIKKHRKDNFMFNEDRFFKKELTSLPKKSASFNVGDEVEVDGVKGEITGIKPMRFSDTCTYKIKLDNGKEVYRYEEEIDNTNESRRQIKMDKRYRNEDYLEDYLEDNIDNVSSIELWNAFKTSVWSNDITDECTERLIRELDNFDSEISKKIILDSIPDDPHIFQDILEKLDFDEHFDESKFVKESSKRPLRKSRRNETLYVDDIAIYNAPETETYEMSAIIRKYGNGKYYINFQDKRNGEGNTIGTAGGYETEKEARAMMKRLRPDYVLVEDIRNESRRNEERKREFVHVKRITGDDYRPGKPKEGFVVGYIEDGIGLRKYFTNEDDARDFVENELKAEFKLDEFYESKKRRNELSTDLKQRFYDKRKAQADRAIKALNRSSKLMANQGIRIPDEVEITFKSGDCETEEDSYEEGVIGVAGTSWYNNKPKTFKLNLKSSDFVKELAEKMGEYLYCYWVGKDDIRVSIDVDKLVLHFSIMGDDNNEEPSKYQIEKWKLGDERLWTIYGYIDVEISETDKPYLIKALKDAGVEVEEF